MRTTIRSGFTSLKITRQSPRRMRVVPLPRVPERLGAGHVGPRFKSRNDRVEARSQADGQLGHVVECFGGDDYAHRASG